MRLLLAEDNRELAHWLEKALVQNGFAVDCVFDGLAADHLLHSETYALAVLDINMPGLDGLEVVQRLRKRGQTLPILLLTARSAVADRVKGLNVGADDYLAKPFEIEELDARLRALLRRAAGRASPTVRHGDIELDPATRTVRQQGVVVEMSPREFSVLLVLMEARGRVLSRQQIEERLYSWNAAIESNAVEVHIHHLRRKLGSACIQTMRGVGYFMPQDAA